MAEFTFTPPPMPQFLKTLRKYLNVIEKENIALLLSDSSCSVTDSTDYSRKRWNAVYTVITFYVPVGLLPKFSEEIKAQLLDAVVAVFPQEVGYDIEECIITARIDEDEEPEELTGLNISSLVSQGSVEHDGLRFRSKTETRIYDALKKQPVLFFPGAAAVLGGKNQKKEPDFLVCQTGKWGILEVMGDPFHPTSRAAQDHDRARLFKDYGLFFVEFYDASECYNYPDRVVDKFLKLLANSRI